jgi:K+-sensing histidine kinase KdpD
MITGEIQSGEVNKLHVLTDVAKTLTRHLDLSELLEAVMDQIARAFELAELGILLLWDPSLGLFRPQTAFGEGLEGLGALQRMALQEGEGITGKVAEKKAALLFETPQEVTWGMKDMRPENRSALRLALGSDTLPSSVIAVPLRAGDLILGVLLLATVRRQQRFGRQDLPFVQTLADLIALAIERDRMESEAFAIREVQEADRLRSEVMATLSHELRTPLAAIKGYTTALLLEEVGWAEEKIEEFLRLIDGECENLQTMIDEILDSSLIDVGHLDIESQPVRLGRLAGQVVDEMQRRTDLHKLLIDIPADFPIVEVDPRRIRQVIRNILDNAIKYSPDGGLIILTGEVRRVDVVIRIADQGVGIAPEDLIPLFEKYFRVKSATGYHVPGTGLGLPVARAIVEAHGGRIWAESKVGEGTTLSFSILRTNIEEEAC